MRTSSVSNAASPREYLLRVAGYLAYTGREPSEEYLLKVAFAFVDGVLSEADVNSVLDLLDPTRTGGLQ